MDDKFHFFGKTWTIKELFVAGLCLLLIFFFGLPLLMNLFNMSLEERALVGDSYNILTSLFSGLGLLGVAIAVIFQAQEMKHAREAMTKTIESEERRYGPELFLDFYIDDTTGARGGYKPVYLRLKNIGLLPAQDISIEVKPEVKRDAELLKNDPKYLVPSFLKYPPHSLSGGEEVLDFIGQASWFYSLYKETIFHIQISYYSPHFAKDYARSYKLSPGYRSELMTVGKSST